MFWVLSGPLHICRCMPQIKMKPDVKADSHVSDHRIRRHHPAEAKVNHLLLTIIFYDCFHQKSTSGGYYRIRTHRNYRCKIFQPYEGEHVRIRWGGFANDTPRIPVHGEQHKRRLITGLKYFCIGQKSTF